MKGWVLLLPALLLLGGCAAPEHAGMRQYQATYLTLFDTVTTMVGYSASEAEFQEKAREIHDELQEYHELFDIYQEYPGKNNLKTVNDNAGIAAVAVDSRIIDLLLDCRALYEQTDGRMDVTMGSVLVLWHQAREKAVNDPEKAALPQRAALEQAAQHTGFDKVHIDRQASTVYLSDPALRLDVGAIAKGWAVERVCRTAQPGLLLSVGGNVRATGPRPTDGSDWVVGIQDPEDSENHLHTLYVREGSVVTSGDYQRYFTVDGVRYHHIIDPDTLFPANRWRSVTILSPDSGLADALSTAVFTLSLEEGQVLARRLGAEVLWIAADGSRYSTPGFQAHIRT